VFHFEYLVALSLFRLDPCGLEMPCFQPHGTYNNRVAICVRTSGSDRVNVKV
jgi:hypothetical protein